MVKQLVLRSPSNKTIIAPAYYGSQKFGVLLGEDQKPVDWRSPKAIHFKRHRQWVLQATDLVHLLKVSTDIPSPAIAADSLSLTTVNPLVIDGVLVQTGDRVEVGSAQATELRISPGTWTATSDRGLTLTNPPVYQLRSSWDFGTPWSFRTLANGNLLGLGALTRTGITTSQTTGSSVGNPSRFGGGLWSNVNMTLSSFQGFNINFNDLAARRLALRATSQKMNYDGSFPAARFGWNSAGRAMGPDLYNYETGVRQTSGASTYSLGQEQFWVTQTYEPARTFSAFTVNDDGMSRATIAMQMYGDIACRLRIGDDFPTNGSTVVISEQVADNTFPAIAAGKYTVIENLEGSQWQLQKQ